MISVGVIGGGAFGTALAHVVGSARGADVFLWADPATAVEVNERRQNERRLPGVTISPRVQATDDLGEVARRARLLVLAVPSTRVADTVAAMGGVVDGRHLVVHAVGAPADPGDDRGAGEGTTGRRVSELLREETSVKRIGALAGPALARDLAEGRPCAVVVASPFAEVVAAARGALDVPSVLRVYGSNDLVGVELASGLSGALTVAIGLADGLGMGAGPRAVLVCRGVAEMARLGVAAGARERTFGGLAGLGNLLVRTSSASSDRSADYQYGVRIARGERVDRAPEGVRAAQGAGALARRLGVRTPLCDAVCAVHDGVPVRQAAARLVETSSEEE